MTLERPRFGTTKLMEGYDCGEVDDFVDRVFHVLAQDEPGMTPEHVRDVRFTPVRLREGYVMGDVDDWLDAVASALREHAAGTPTAVVEPTAATAPTYVPEHTGSDAIVRAEDRSTRVALAWGLAVVAVVLVLAALL